MISRYIDARIYKEMRETLDTAMQPFIKQAFQIINTSDVKYIVTTDNIKIVYPIKTLRLLVLVRKAARMTENEIVNCFKKKYGLLFK